MSLEIDPNYYWAFCNEAPITNFICSDRRECCFVDCRISFGVCGRFTAAEILSFFLSFMIVCIWVLTGHWLLMDGRGPKLNSTKPWYLNKEQNTVTHANHFTLKLIQCNWNILYKKNNFLPSWKGFSLHDKYNYVKNLTNIKFFTSVDVCL